MSLPPKVVPKTAAVAVSGPGSGPSPSNLRAALTSLQPGAPTAPQPGAVPPQYPFTWLTCNIDVLWFVTLAALRV